MNNSFDEDFEENVRPPDEVVRERLLQDTRSDFDKELDEVLNLSMREFHQQQIMNDQYEEQIKKSFIEEVNKRKNIFQTLLLNLNKLIKFDKEVREIYDIIEPIIDSYCGLFIETCELDKITHNKIFDMLRKIRVNQKAVEILKTIIVEQKS